MVVAALAVVLGAAAVYFFALTARYEIPSESMLPTYEVGDTVTINKLDKSAEVGDVVVFHPPVGATHGGRCGAPHPRDEMCSKPTPDVAEDAEFVKRVVAVGGDRVSMRNGEAIVAGEPVTGDWETRPCRSRFACDYPRPITIPDGYLFLLGDNRGASDDSRFWGPVPEDSIIGVAG